ncbi:MAG TPA: hypothetical protein VG142_04700 [Trebonia sp.]|nr:hypothetical protein [Trebonia sp.]
MPPAADRPRWVELLLCAHHFRASRENLAAAGAVVREVAASADSPTELVPL